jgi:hypothetical protein
LACCKVDEILTPGAGKPVRKDDHAIVLPSDDGPERWFKIHIASDLMGRDCDAEALCGFLRCFQRFPFNAVGIPNSRQARSPSINFLQQLKTQSISFGGHIGGEACKISTWPRKADHQTVGNGVGRVRSHDWYRAGGLHDGSNSSIWANDDYVRL